MNVFYGKIDLSSVTENSNTGETTESITSINLITTESANSNNLEAMESVTNGAKADAEKEEKAAVTIAGAGSGDGEQQSFNRDLEFDGNTSKLPSLFSGPRTYLTREVSFFLTYFSSYSSYIPAKLIRTSLYHLLVGLQSNITIGKLVLKIVVNLTKLLIISLLIDGIEQKEVQTKIKMILKDEMAILSNFS